MTLIVPRAVLAYGLCLVVACSNWPASAADPVFRAGAAVSDITPTRYPVIVNAMFEERSATNAYDRLQARCLALDNERERVLIAVVDSCMLPRDLIDETKRLVAAQTGFPVDHMLISATHTHSAPSAMGCLGSRVDPDYARSLPGRIAEGMIRSLQTLAPARVGWGAIDDYEHTHCRRWIRRPDRLLTDPFGVQNVRANMHPGHESPDAIGPSGPVDPALSVLSIQTAEGKPLALLANYSMHYYESPLLSADYYGLFATKIARLIGAEGGNEPFVGIMSQGTSGDQMWMDYGAPRKQIGLDAYAQEMAEVAAQAYRKIEHRPWAPLAMREAKLTLGFRVPDDKRLAWARELAAKIGDRLPRGMAEIYAKEAIYLHDRPTAELVLQAIRVGDLGIAAMPNEVYAISGLKIKAQSPLPLTFNIELANGSEGYIPPPEQHRLGGYTTWPARTAGLETNAEPKIVEQTLQLLEAVAGQPRRRIVETHGDYARAVLAARPLGYWRLNEFSGPEAAEAGGGAPAHYLGDVAYYLDGPQAPGFSGTQTNRAPHFAGGHLQIPALLSGQVYSVEFWFWNGLPADARGLTGELLAFGGTGDRLYLGGTNGSPGRLVLSVGGESGRKIAGRSIIKTREWNYIALVREEERISVYLNGALEMTEAISGSAESRGAALTLAGRKGSAFSLEGKIDEIAVYGRSLDGAEIARHATLGGIRVATAEAMKSPDSGQALSSPAGTSSLPRTPAETLASLHVPEGYAVELVAAEPLVASPVAIDWGTDGRLWVVEMADYPYGMDGKMRPGGRVRVLEDTDGDGRMDKATVFLDGINFPNGVISWRKGVIVTAAPDIFYAEDTDEDGKADKREVLYTGFREGNLQLRINGLRWGLDNWLHCANGWSGGQPRSVKTGVQVNLDGRDLRIEPERGLIEVESGQSEFGRNPDNWGEWFGCDNSYPVFHFVLEDRYMRRNPHIPAPQAKRQLYLPANPKVYPLSREQKRYHSFEHASHFTSACSTDFYRDERLFPAGPEQHVFICEPVHNLVQHLLMREDGVSFSVQRAERESEPDFLASPDQWFRPVMARMGPDGALWVVDMYRYMIEHPDWLPEEGKRELAPFYRAGEDRGRIYRVVRRGEDPRTSGSRWPRLDQKSPEELVRVLESSNGWLRDKAQQLLVWRQEKSVGPALEAMVTAGTKPLARLHALATLDGLGSVSSEVLARALRDESPAVRREAIRLTESHTNSTELLTTLTRLAEDPDPKVRLQLACTLGEWEGREAGAALASVALRDASDSYILAAVMSSASKHITALVRGTITANSQSADRLVEPLLQLALGLGDREQVAALLHRVLAVGGHSYRAAQMETMAAFLDSVARSNLSVAQFQAERQDTLASELRRLDAMVAAAWRYVSDQTQDVPVRVASARLLGRQSAEMERDLRLLAELLTPHTPGELARAAVRSMAMTGLPGAPSALLKSWRAQGPEIRAAIVDEMIGREAWSEELLRRIERGEIAALDVSVVSRDRLLKHRSAPVRNLAAQVFAGATSSNRQQAVDEFRSVFSLEADAKRGRAVFGRVCSVCHQLEGVGREIGPNLDSVRAHPPEKLLTSILDPSREVEPRYLAYTCTLSDGDEVYGLIASETGNGIEMKLSDGTSQRILRRDIASLQSARVSLMPDGLEATLSRQDLADVIRYLRTSPGQDQP